MDFTTILDLIQRRTNTQNTTTSSYPIAAKTVDVNNALIDYFILANQFAGNWRPADDTNQTDYPIIYANIVGSPTPQQDYSFSTDENGNQILDIYKVRLLQPDGVTWVTLDQIDQNTITDAQLNTTTSGTPTQYYLTANGIFLVQKPNYNATNGLEVWINRTPTFFTVSDTTKKPGIYWMHHKYLALKPSYEYCYSKGLPQTENLRVELFGVDGKGGLENEIKKYHANRNRAIKRNIAPARQNNK